MLIYNNARGQATPALNATATVMVVITLLSVGLGLIAYRIATRLEDIGALTDDTDEDFVALAPAST